MPDKKQIGGVNWELANDSAREWARRHSAQLVGGILDTTRDKIRRNVADFVENQRTFGELTANIQASGAFNQARANLIAVTETTGSYAEGNMVAWKESGVTEATMWNTNNDSLVCTICGPLDGVVVPLGSEFDGGGEGPPAHPGCRCWLTPRMLGDTETRADIDATYGLERMPGIGAPSVPVQQIMEWQPSMTRAEAEEWAAESAIQQNVYHVTSRTGEAGILEEGFSLEHKNFGRIWGDGVYVSANDETTALYEAWESKWGKPSKLTMRLNVRNPYIYDVNDARLLAEYRPGPTMPGERVKPDIIQAEIINDVLGTTTRGEAWEARKLAAESLGITDWADQVSAGFAKILQDAGYDSFWLNDSIAGANYGGNQIVIFDPRNVVVVR